MSCSEECKRPCYECKHQAIKDTINSIHKEVANENYIKGIETEKTKCIRILEQLLEDESQWRSEVLIFDTGVIQGINKSIEALKKEL